MRKIRLELDELAVESFATDAGGGARGTVEGQSDYTNPETVQPSMQTGHEGCPSCPVSGNASCMGTCPQDTFTCYTCSVVGGAGVLLPEC